MSDLTIRTNGQKRFTLDWHDLTEKERGEFDYLDTDDRRSEATFVRYRGWVYDLGEFMATRDMSESPLARWHGYHTDSAFSGVLVKWASGRESVVMGNFYS